MVDHIPISRDTLLDMIYTCPKYPTPEGLDNAITYIGNYLRDPNFAEGKIDRVAVIQKKIGEPFNSYGFPYSETVDGLFLYEWNGEEFGYDKDTFVFHPVRLYTITAYRLLYQPRHQDVKDKYGQGVIT